LRERLDDKAKILASTLANMQEGILMADAQGRVLTINDQALELLGLDRAELSVPTFYTNLPLLKFEEKLGGALQPSLEIEFQPERFLEVRTSLLADGGFVKTLSDVTDRRRNQDMLLEARDRAETASRARTAFLATMSHEIRTPVAGIVSMADLMGATPLDHMQRRYVEITRESAEHLLTLLSDVLDVTKLDADQVSLETIRFDLFRELRCALDILGTKAIEKGLVLGCAIAPDVPREITGDPSRLRQVLLNLIGNAIKFTERGHVLLSVTRLQDGAEDRLLISIEDTGIGVAKDNLRGLFRDFSQIDSSISRRFGGTGLGLSISRKLIIRMGGSIGVRSELGQGSTFFFEVPLKGFVEPPPVVPKPAAIAIVSPDSFERALIARQVALIYSDVAAFTTYQEAQSWLTSNKAQRRILLTELSLVPTQIETCADLGFDVYLLCTRQDFFAYEHASELSCAGLVQKPIFLDDLRESLSRPISAAPSLAAVESVSPLAHKLDGLRVLLAEDNATNQFALRRMLENMGAQVTAAKDGGEALQQARKQTFDVILMDVMMPELDGLAAARALRTMGGPHQTVPIIALTASAFAEDREAAFAAGMNAFATKPITARGLLESIDACLNHAPHMASEHVPVSVSAQDVPTLDRKFLDQMAEDLGPQHLTQALQVFMKDLQQRAQALREEGEDADRLRKAAHAIKGSAASFGFTRLARVAEDLEVAARSGEVARFSDLKDRLLREAAAAPDYMSLV
jgi:signal transduction histidine kinase/CheY-like chemotaxis protein